MSDVRHHTRVSLLLAAIFCTASSGIHAQAPKSAAESLPPGSGAAKLISFTGQISYLRGTESWALNLGDLVQPEQIIVTGADGYGVFQLADGSKFEVFPKSRVVFRANRGDWRDLLELWLGKVRVEIEHPGGLPNNNKVRTPTAVISVRGTIFDVEVDEEASTTLVIDEEGTVSVQHLLKPGNARILNAGEYVRIYKDEPLAKQMIDKGGLIRRALDAARDALYDVALNSHGAPTVARTGGGAGLPADHTGGNGPPPTPPPPKPTQ